MSGKKHTNIIPMVLAGLLGAVVFAIGALAFAPRSDASTIRVKSCSEVARAWPKKQRARFAQGCKKRVAAHNRRVYCNHPSRTPLQSIDCIWPAALRAQAKRVARCESTAHVSNAVAKRNKLGRWAKNGQYIGVFQMGTNERAAYGQYSVGSAARLQVQSAYNLYKARGWQPWACRP